jgi:hypothetical protein
MTPTGKQSLTYHLYTPVAKEIEIGNLSFYCSQAIGRFLSNVKDGYFYVPCI